MPLFSIKKAPVILCGQGDILVRGLVSSAGVI